MGNGVAGNTAGSAIRQLDTQADITIVSEEVYPEYTVCALPHYLAGELRRQKLFLKTRKDYSRERIRTVFGQRATSISPESKRLFLDSKSLAYDKLIIATGSAPIMPPIQGIGLDGVFTLKSLGDADRILDGTGNTAVVVGSGPIGVETSIALSKQGSQVYLIEVLDRVMPRVFDKVPASLLKGIIEESGVRVLTEEKVVSIVGDGRVEGIVTNKQRIRCDMVVLGCGMKPNTELAEQAGIGIGALGGISVTRQMMTNLDDIYACGDCVETEDMATGEQALSPLWHNARRQGEVAGYNCAGVPRSYPGSQNITSLNIAGVHAVSFGSTEGEANEDEDVEVIERSIGRSYYRLVVSKGRLAGAQSIGDARDMGALLSVLLKGDSQNDIIRMNGERTLPPNHVCYRVARYMAPHH